MPPTAWSSRASALISAGSPRRKARSRIRPAFAFLPAGDDALATRLELVRRAGSPADRPVLPDRRRRHRPQLSARSFVTPRLRGVRPPVDDDPAPRGEDELLLASRRRRISSCACSTLPRPGAAVLPSRFAASLFDFRSANRRTHNKLFVADGAIAVVGGRNIGDAYLGQSWATTSSTDVAVVGALVPRLGVLFDRYWNSEFVRLDRHGRVL